MAEKPESKRSVRTRSRARRTIGGAIALVLVASVAARALVSTETTERPDAGSELAPGSFLPGDSPGSRSEPSPSQADEGVREALPIVTEASFFGLLGFAVGYTTRKLVKLGLIVLALFFLGLQGLSFAGVVQVDWSRALELANDLVFNIRSDQSAGEFLKHRIPSLGALVAGYLLGFRRG